MASSAARVFAVPELLENILLKLPWIDLFKICRINKTWRDTINGSPKLRRRLYLDFEQPSNEPQFGTSNANIDNKINPTFVYLIKNGLIYKQLGSDHNSWPCVTACKKSPDRQLRYSLHFPTPRNPNTEAFAKHLRIRGDGRQASWRAMKLTRFCGAIRLLITISSEDSDWAHVHAVEFAAWDGSLGELVDVVDRVRRDAADRSSRNLKLPAFSSPGW